MLIDRHNRTLDYLRIAVTDRCNLRCFYCMPESGNEYEPQSELMTYEEILRIFDIMYQEGVRKVRITGGEPFLRKDVMILIRQLAAYEGVTVHITTNGTLTRPHLTELKRLGVVHINLSLDSLNKDRFTKITRRDAFDEVMKCLNEILALEMTLKINMVVMKGVNEEDIIPMAELAERHPLEVRFLEEMPFNGGMGERKVVMTFQDIEAVLKGVVPDLIKLPSKYGATADTYSSNQLRGKLGIIASFSRTFCGTCNRLRLTPKGDLRTCLYDHQSVNLKDLIRNGASDDEVLTLIKEAVLHKAVDGHEAERRSHLSFESMARIGG